MALVVTQVAPKGEKAAMILLSDSTQIWTPEYEKAKDLVGKPMPADWTMKEGQYGPQAFPPRPKGGGMPPAYRNSKEGQAYEQERMDRRTALMQAVAATDIPSRVLDLANEYYTWLRETAGSAGSGLPPVTAAGPAPTSPQPTEARREKTAAGDEGQGGTAQLGGEDLAFMGEAVGTSSPNCVHARTRPHVLSSGKVSEKLVYCDDCASVVKKADVAA